MGLEYKYIAVSGCTFKLSPPSLDPLTVVSLGILPSTKVKVNGKGCYAANSKLGAIITIVGYIGGKVTKPGEGAGKIKPTATKVKLGLNTPFREGDSCTVKVIQTDNPLKIENVKVTISNAGQSKVKAK